MYVTQLVQEIPLRVVFIGYLAKTEDISFNNMKNAIVYGATLASFCVENLVQNVWFLLPKTKFLEDFFTLKN